MGNKKIYRSRITHLHCAFNNCLRWNGWRVENFNHESNTPPKIYCNWHELKLTAATEVKYLIQKIFQVDYYVKKEQFTRISSGLYWYLSIKISVSPHSLEMTNHRNSRRRQALSINLGRSSMISSHFSHLWMRQKKGTFRWN